MLISHPSRYDTFLRFPIIVADYFTQPKATISTVSNVASASMESALPTTIATSTMLAPEEVFSSSSRSMRAKNELTPEEKRAQRNKDKKIRRKQRDHLDSTAKTVTDVKKAGSVKKQKEAALKSVVKSGKGVTVVGKMKKSGSKPPPK
jgi:U3 small nucleolar RNA-associated protein MPP10